MTEPLPLTAEQIDEIAAGCEGVTPGPWHRLERCGELSVLGHPAWPCATNGREGYWTVAVIDDLVADHPYEVLSNAAHIARLDPATVLALCRAAKKGIEAEWQDIATAPKDGRQIAVWIADGDTSPHCFSPVSITSDAGWWDHSTGDQIEPIKGATHWRSISPPVQP